MAATAAVGCGDDGGSTDAFCADLRAQASTLMNPALSSQADVEAYLALHEDLGDDVPLAVEEDWDVYVDALRQAVAVVPGDQASVEEARRAIYAAEESAFRVVDWVNTNCGLDLSTAGPVARFDPTATSTTVTTTAP